MISLVRLVGRGADTRLRFFIINQGITDMVDIGIVFIRNHRVIQGRIILKVSWLIGHQWFQFPAK